MITTSPHRPDVRCAASPMIQYTIKHVSQTCLLLSSCIASSALVYALDIGNTKCMAPDLQKIHNPHPDDVFHFVLICKTFSAATDD